MDDIDAQQLGFGFAEVKQVWPDGRLEISIKHSGAANKYDQRQENFYLAFGFWMYVREKIQFPGCSAQAQSHNYHPAG